MLVNHQLKVDHSNSLLAIVDNIACPGLAFNVDQDTSSWPLEVNSHHRTEVTLGVLVRIEVSRESLPWNVFDWSNIFYICWTLTFTAYPDCVEQLTIDFLLVNNVVFEVFWHFLWQVIGVIIKLWSPIIDLVKFDEDAGCRLVEVEAVFLRTWEPIFDVHVTHLIFIRGPVIITIVDILTTTGGQTWYPVHFKEFFQALGPELVLFRVCSLIPNQSTFHVLIWRSGPETKTWRRPYEGTTELAGWNPGVQRLGKHPQADSKQSNEDSIKDKVEQSDLAPTCTSPSKNSSSLTVVEK